MRDICILLLLHKCVTFVIIYTTKRKQQTRRRYKVMRKFEIGKTYRTGSYVFEVLKRTNKTVRVIQIQHEGRSNERRYDERTCKIQDWGDREVFFAKDVTFEA